MRRLWVQLSLATSGVVLISALLLFIIIGTYADSQRQLLTDELRASMQENVLHGDLGAVSQLQTLFAEGGTLDQAAALLAGIDRSQPPSTFRINYTLRSIEGEVIYGDLPPGDTHEQVTLDNALLEFEIVATPRPVDSVGILSPENIVVVLGSIGILTGVIVSVMVSRWLAAPLSRLAQTARQVGHHDFSLRVQPGGSEEMRDVARAFNEMAARLEESEQLRSNLIADVAHELRTPLTVMGSNLRALIDDVHPLTKMEILTLYDQTHHLSHLVNDLHELSLADANELKVVHEPLLLNDLLSSITEIFKPVAETEGIDFVVSTPAEALYVSGDRVRLGQVLQNLLVNALRHTSSGGKIMLQTEERAGKVCLQIEDTGEGIPTEHLSHIFERFYRADRSRDRTSGGTGLGLAIGKAIIEAHGGTITVSSEVAKPSGTCFSIYLPVYSP